jgi:hypothetical protein
VIPVIIITYRCVSSCFLSVVTTMSEQVAPSAVAQRIIVKFLTNENVRLPYILMRLRAQFDDEKLSRIHVYDWSKLFKEGRRKVDNMRRLQHLQGKCIGEWRYSSTHSLTSKLDECEGSALRQGRFNRRERAPSTHWIGGWVGSRAGLDTVSKRKILSPRRESKPDHPIVQLVVGRYTD